MSTLYVTPQAITAAHQCRRIRMVNDVAMFSAVMGALLQLTYESNWVQTTGISPALAAAAAQEMYDDCAESLGFCMTGQIVAFAGDTAPDRWLMCDGTTYLRVDYPDLYATLDAAFIVDADHFSVPDLRGRTLLGAGSGPGLTPRSVGATGGEEAHQLTVAELASHSHSISTQLPIGTAVPPPLDDLIQNPFPGSTGNTGGDTPHNNMQPFLALNYIIQAE